MRPKGVGGVVRIKYLYHNLWLEFSIICWTLLILLWQSSWQVSVEITKINQSINQSINKQSFNQSIKVLGITYYFTQYTYQYHERELPGRCLKQLVFISVLRIHLILMRIWILDPHWKKWIRIRIRIRIQEAKILRIQRIRILSTGLFDFNFMFPYIKIKVHLLTDL